MSTKKKKADEPLENNDSLEEMSFEQQFERLDELVARMEDEDTTLEESFESYREGMMLVKSLNGMIDHIEKEVMVLSGQEKEEEAFDDE